VTKLPEGGIPDELYERVRGELSEKDISDLTFSIMVINAGTAPASPSRSCPLR